MKNWLVLTFYLFIFGVFPQISQAATLSLSPSTGTFNKGCSVTLDINLDTEGADTDGTDAILIYDNTRFTANSINTELAPKIYSDYPGSNIDEAAGKITVSGLASVSSAFNGKGTLAKINFTVKEQSPTGATQIKFDFDPKDKTKTTDSNVVQRGTIADILSSVVDGSYTVGTGSCIAQSPAPSPGTPGTPGTIGRGTPGNATPSASTPPGTLPDRGTPQLTYTLAIVGSVLTILGILGLALL